MMQYFHYGINLVCTWIKIEFQRQTLIVGELSRIRGLYPSYAICLYGISTISTISFQRITKIGFAYLMKNMYQKHGEKRRISKTIMKKNKAKYNNPNTNPN